MMGFGWKWILCGVLALVYVITECLTQYYHYFDMTEYEKLVEFWYIHLLVVPIIGSYLFARYTN